MEVVFDSPGLADFTVGLVDSDGQIRFFGGNIFIEESQSKEVL